MEGGGSLQEDLSKRPQFGTRVLKKESDVFKHNAWDNVEWSDEQEENARQVVTDQLNNCLDKNEHKQYLEEPSKQWDKFYEKHDNKFFKDRHWLFTEFPELLSQTNTSVSNDHSNDTKHNKEADLNDFPGCKAKKRILEVGCGAGNTIFPVLRTNSNPDLYVYGCDYSSTAVDVVRTNPAYNEERCFAFVHDISKDDPYPMPEESLDVIVMIFVLSALPFDKMSSALERLKKLLKPGGIILFRDYGRYDMAQLRFKSNRCLSENFYTRGDGTLVYFFTQEEVKHLFESLGLSEEQNLVDRRLQVNRARQLKMFRVWIQAKYKKME